MSSFEDVRRSVCKVLGPNGNVRGTAFFVLPDGHALTCHHVVFGLSEIQVQLPNESTPRAAVYDAARSNPEGDIAVLAVGDASPPAIQLGRSRTGVDIVDGYGFRPTAIAAEPEGHAFTGRLGPGQRLDLLPPPEDARSAGLGDRKHRPWNELAHGYRTGPVLNFELVEGVQPGISGGPIYDRDLRRVTGIFRAVEGSSLAYVLPVDAVFEHWPELEKDNKGAVPDSAIDRLAPLGIRLVAEGADPISSLEARHHCDEVVRDHALFGGRRQELQTLIDFARSEDRGYLFVTGPLGYGKTALLVALTRALAHDKPAPVVHFLDRRYQKWLGWRPGLENLCRQLMMIHGLGGRLPDTEHGLSVLYVELLALPPPPGQQVVVILDGIEEAIGLWDIGASLFPAELPARVKLIFSAQAMADRDWLKDFRLPLSPDRVLTIDRLKLSDVTDILTVSGVATPTPEATAARLLELSGGDPFDLAELLVDLRNVAGDPDRLHPSSTSRGPLPTWWAELTETVGPAFPDLMCTLAVAVAPLRKEELVAVDPDDELKGTTMPAVLRSAARYITGDHEHGYQLKHARVRRFVMNEMADTIADYRRRLSDYCLRWHWPGSGKIAMRYALEHGVHQLIESGDVARVRELLTPEFIAAQFQHTHSFRGYIQDLSLTASALYRENPAAVADVFGLAVARQTVRDAISAIPVDVFTAWIRLGEVARALAVVEDISEARGAVSMHLIAMAKELLRAEHAGRTLGSRTYADIASALLQRALDLLPRLRWAEMRYEGLDDLVRVVTISSGITSERRLQLAQQAVHWGESIVDPAERSIVLGLASYLAAAGGDRQLGETALSLAEAAIARNVLAPDRLLAFAYRIQAIQQLVPDELEARFAGVDAVDIAPSSLAPRLLAGRAAIRKLGELGAVGVKFLRQLASRSGPDVGGRRHHTQELVNALVSAGAVDDAIALIDKVHGSLPPERDPVLDGLERLDLLAQARDRGWWAEACRRAAPHVLAGIGEWKPALDRLHEMHSDDLARELLAIMRTIEANLPAGHVPPEVWSELIGIIGTLTEPMRRAECLAAAALAASRDGEQARGLADEATRIVVSRSLDAGTENLQSLHAVALHQDGRHVEAAQAALRVERVDLAADTLVALTEYAAPDAPANTIYAQALSDLVDRSSRVYDPRRPYIHEQVAAAALRFVRAHPDLGKVVYERLSRESKTPVIASELAVTTCVLDPGTGSARCVDLVASFASTPPSEQLHLFSALLTLLARSAPELPDPSGIVASVDQRVQSLELPDNRKIELLAAEATLLARSDCKTAIGLLRRALAALASPRQKSLAERAAMEFVAWTGLAAHGPSGHMLDEADDAVQVWDAALLALEADPEGALDILGGVLDAVKQLASPPDETTALMRILASATGLAPATAAVIGGRFDQAIDQARSIPRRDYQTMALQSAVRAFVQAGDISRATRAAASIVADNPFDKMEVVVAAAQQRDAPLTPIERHLLRLLPEHNLAFFTAYLPDKAGRQSAIHTAIKALLTEMKLSTELDKRLTRQSLLQVVLCYACPLYRSGGVDVIGAIAHTIRDYDARFARTGALIMSRAPETGPAKHGEEWITRDGVTVTAP